MCFSAISGICSNSQLASGSGRDNISAQSKYENVIVNNFKDPFEGFEEAIKDSEIITIRQKVSPHIVKICNFLNLMFQLENSSGFKKFETLLLDMIIVEDINKTISRIANTAWILLSYKSIKLHFFNWWISNVDPLALQSLNSFQIIFWHIFLLFTINISYFLLFQNQMANWLLNRKLIWYS